MLKQLTSFYYFYETDIVKTETMPSSAISEID